MPNDHRIGIGRVIEARQRTERLGDLRGERNRTRSAGRDFDSHDLAAVTRDQRLAVGGERGPRREIAGGRALLVVTLAVLDEPALVAGREIPEPERAGPEPEPVAAAQPSPPEAECPHPADARDYQTGTCAACGAILWD